MASSKRRGGFSAVLALALISLSFAVLVPIAIFFGAGHNYFSFPSWDQLAVAPIPTTYLFDTNKQPADDTNHDGFAACLLIKDVNHWLPEWIAYHHVFLPLTELIVAVDPHSIQSPRPVLERFNTTISSLHIDMWYDEDYISAVEMQDMPNYPPKGAPPDMWADMIKARYLFRQNWFMSKCLSEFQGRNRTEWVLLHDVDEFVAFNRNGSRIWKPELMPVYSEGTLLDYIQSTQHDAQSPFNETETCIPMPRLLFGSKASSLEQISDMIPSDFDARNFATLRYRHHVSRTDVRASGFVKPLINVRRSPQTGSFNEEPAHNPHRPYPRPGQICRSYTIMQHLKSDWAINASPLVMNHYVGSWESFSFGRRWFLERFNETREVSGGQSDDIRPWLAAFVAKLGNEKAKFLLEGSGNVHYDYGALNDSRLGTQYEDSDVPLEKVLAEVKAKKDAAKDVAKQRASKMVVKSNIGGLKVLRAGN